jgi:hypothetical protein
VGIATLKIAVVTAAGLFVGALLGAVVFGAFGLFTWDHPEMFSSTPGELASLMAYMGIIYCFIPGAFIGLSTGLFRLGVVGGTALGALTGLGFTLWSFPQTTMNDVWGKLQFAYPLMGAAVGFGAALVNRSLWPMPR